MKEIMIYGRARQKFQLLFPDAIFEGYECGIRFCYFRFKKYISDNKIKNICENNKIKYEIE